MKGHPWLLRIFRIFMTLVLLAGVLYVLWVWAHVN
jgi:hypothetical protein